MSDIKKLSGIVKKFSEDRNWDQFHNPKDVSLSLMLEAAEILEHFQWRNGEELEKHLHDHKEEIEDEIADVMWYILHLCDELDVDLVKAFERKAAKNEKKYPVEKSYGNNKKYTEL